MDWTARKCRGCVCWRTFLLFFVLSLFIISCDGSLTVKGEIVTTPPSTEEECEISLWWLSGFFWSDKVPTKNKEEVVNGKFNVHWTIGGPARPQWIEIYCAGYEPFKSEEYVVPSKTRMVDLGTVSLKKLEK